MSKLYRRPENDIYYVRYKENGRYRYISTGTTNKRAAQSERRRIDAELLKRAQARKEDITANVITVAQVVDFFLAHAEQYYRKSDGTPTATIDQYAQAGRALKVKHGDLPATEFGPLKLRALRDQWVADGKARSTCNRYARSVVQMFKHAAANELIPGNVPVDLSMLRGIPAGRGLAKETKKIRPVSLKDVQEIRPRVSRQVRALVDLQLLTAARSGELLNLRPRDIDTSKEIWVAHVGDHKTAHHGKIRELYFGPKAQGILRPFMLRDADAYLFSPREAEAERRAHASTHRRPDQVETPRETDRTLGDYYTSHSYRRAIERACAEVGVPRWTPHQLRHTAATTIRREYGLEAAQVILGHSTADVTQVYAEVNRQRGMAIMEEIG